MSLPVPYYSHGGITIYHGDCRDILPFVKADAVVTDPPYGIGKAEWDVNDWPLLRMVADCPTDVFMFCAGPLLDTARVELSPDRVIWCCKDYVQLRPVPIQWACDPILAWLRNKTPNYTRRDWFTVTTADTGKKERGHPTPKHENAMLRLVNEYTKGSIVDPFMGSGTTLLAAQRLRRQAIGIEIEERYCEIAVKRLAQEVLPYAPPEPQPEQAEMFQGGCDD